MYQVWTEVFFIFWVQKIDIIFIKKSITIINFEIQILWILKKIV